MYNSSVLVLLVLVILRDLEQLPVQNSLCSINSVTISSFCSMERHISSVVLVLLDKKLSTKSLIFTLLAVTVHAPLDNDDGVVTVEYVNGGNNGEIVVDGENSGEDVNGCVGMMLVGVTGGSVCDVDAIGGSMSYGEVMDVSGSSEVNVTGGVWIVQVSVVDVDAIGGNMSYGEVNTMDASGASVVNVTGGSGV